MPDVAVAVAELRDEALERGQEGFLVGVDGGGGQGIPQRRRPVGPNHIEVWIEMLEDVPGEGDCGQAGAPVLSRREGATRRRLRG